MPSKDETRPSGLRALFNRKKRNQSNSKLSTSTENSEEIGPREVQPKQKQEQEHTNTPAGRRKYTPRYAERDMILSMPVDQRPDLVGAVKEARLQNVCSEIGFNTALRPGNASARSGATSRASSGYPLSTHPNLPISRQAVVTASSRGRSTYTASLNAMPQGSGMSRLGPSPLQRSESAVGSVSRGSIPRQRPPLRHVNTIASTPFSTGARSFQFGGDDDDDGSEAGRPTTAGSQFAADASHNFSARATTRPARQYFSHNGALPNLRANRNTGGVDKGKGKAASTEASVFVISEPGQCVQFNEAPESYVIKTGPPPQKQAHLAPFLSSHSSRGSSVTDSNDSRHAGGSTTAESLETGITELSEEEDAEAEKAASGTVGNDKSKQTTTPSNDGETQQRKRTA